MENWTFEITQQKIRKKPPFQPITFDLTELMEFGQVK